MEQDKKNLIYVVVTIIVLVLLGMWLFGKEGTGDEGSAAIPPPPPPSVSVQVKLTPEEKSGDVSDKKAEILSRIRSNTPLTTAEKQEIQLIMATKANIYKFSEEERQEIFAAFNR